MAKVGFPTRTIILELVSAGRADVGLRGESNQDPHDQPEAHREEREKQVHDVVGYVAAEGADVVAVRAVKVRHRFHWLSSVGVVASRQGSHR